MSKNYPDSIPEQFAGDDIMADAYRVGWNHGRGLAYENKPRLEDKINPCVDWVGLGPLVNDENVRDYHQLLCEHAAWESSRFNKYEHGDLSDEAWGAYRQGVEGSIAADVAEYTEEDYGIPGEGDYRAAVETILGEDVEVDETVPVDIRGNGAWVTCRVYITREQAQDEM